MVTERASITHAQPMAVTAQLAAVVGLWSISVLVKAVGVVIKISLQSVGLQFSFQNFVLSFWTKTHVSSKYNKTFATQKTNGIWKVDVKVWSQWKELIHIGKKDGVWSLSPSWRNINSAENERKENGCLYYLLGREFSPQPLSRFKNKAWI